MKISCVPGEKGGEKSGCSHSLELCQIVGELTLAQLNATATNLSPILSPPPPDYTTFKLPPRSATRDARPSLTPPLTFEYHELFETRVSFHSTLPPFELN